MMYYFFSSNYPAVIKLNGIYYGEITDTLKSINIETQDLPFIEVCPLNGIAEPLNFLLCDDFLSYPPDNVCVTDLVGGYMLKFNATTKKQQFSVINQQKFSNAVVTVFNDNGLKISVETPSDFFAKSLNMPADSAEITPFTLNGCNLIAVNFSGGKNVLAVYSLDRKVNELFFREVFSYSLDGGLTTVEKLTDMAKHVITVNWELTNHLLTEKSRSVNRSEKFKIDNLPKPLLPYAFIEELYASGQVLDYLSNGIKENADKLCAYFGEFIGVMPPPIFRSPEELGLIYKISSNKYSVKYFTFELEDRKICNIKKSD